MMILLMLNLIISLIFILLNHPMTMGLALLSQTIVVAFLTGFFNINFWFSYILFLIMIGGLLVLFIYMTSIASNEMFKYSNNFLLFSLFIFLTLMIKFMKLDFFMLNLNFLFLETLNDSFYNNNLSMTKFFNYPSMMIILLLIIYLFITLIAVVKITKISSGPLRQKY